jgi:hypothetical protein
MTTTDRQRLLADIDEEIKEAALEVNRAEDKVSEALFGLQELFEEREALVNGRVLP